MRCVTQLVVIMELPNKYHFGIASNWRNGVLFCNHYQHVLQSQRFKYKACFCECGRLVSFTLSNTQHCRNHMLSPLRDKFWVCKSISVIDMHTWNLPCSGKEPMTTTWILVVQVDTHKCHYEHYVNLTMGPPYMISPWIIESTLWLEGPNFQGTYELRSYIFVRNLPYS